VFTVLDPRQDTCQEIFPYLASSQNVKLHSRIVQRTRRRLFFSFEEEERERERERERVRSDGVTGLRNTRERAATCATRHASRVQTPPRHFVHPWIICDAMPNASTAAASLSICMHPRDAAALASRKRQRPNNKSAAPGRTVAPRPR